jgi:membrane-bound lytic murein transglycosylase B
VNKLKAICISVLLIYSAVISGVSASEAQISFAEYLQGLQQEALQLGFAEDFVQQSLAEVTYHQKAVSADKNQPETKITLDTYLATRVPDWKVKQALTLMAEHQVLLDKIALQYGVQARFIVALWGNESNFGKITGNFPVLSALASLAYDGRREAFFKKEFFAALTILQEDHLSLDDFKGSWAGAMGQSQFMPSSFLAYAQDFDGDGKRDIWRNQADVFASIAQFLAKQGWQDELTWGRQVKVPEDFDFAAVGLEQSKRRTLTDWQALGIRRYEGGDLPTLKIDASLIAPDGPNGRIYLVYENFHTLMKWNRSSYFGVTVGYLADRIKKGS